MLSSAEVGTLVTALGCGIGRSEFELDKLRYHRVIIMTDADVDGSHIRTLLLTFFFRHMAELIEAGHVFIALPPLYKVKRGRQERYVKDDDELEAYFLQSALDGSRLYVNPDAPPIDPAVLERLARDYQDLETRLEALDRVYPAPLTKALLDAPPLDLDDLRDADRMAEWLGAYAEALPSDTEYDVTLELDREHQVHRPRIAWQAHGIAQSSVLGYDFFAVRGVRTLEGGRGNVSGICSRKEPTSSAGNSAARSRRSRMRSRGCATRLRGGVVIQRYKGLGEMDPEQLWETTMDPEVRRMLRVSVDDVIAADQMFATLMGEHVEPRREFIEANALSVVNLDV